MEFLKELDAHQLEPVLFTEGPVLVIAGAGSGKTRVLTYRILYIIESNKPENILAVTFTNKAADEMKERIENLIGKEKAEKLWIGTFHKVAVRILRKHASKIGYSSNFSIYDREDQKNVLKEILGIRGKELDKIQTIISRYKSGLGLNVSEGEVSIDLISQYNEKLKELNAMDFDDLLLNLLKLFRNYEDVKNYYAQKFKYIHVDEYQDTNRIQRRILKHLGSFWRNVFVVGDEDQSIYGFRGADMRNILEFEKDFPGAKVFFLGKNYRSTQIIVKAAESVIRHNKMRRHKRLWSENKLGEKIKVIETQDEIQEAEAVAEIILSSKRNFKDFLVVYRTNAQSRAIEEILRKYNIPYKIYGGIRFYERKEIKDILAYLKVFVNPDDEVNLKRIINTPPRGIGKSALKLIENKSASENATTWQVLNGKLDFLPSKTVIAIKDFLKIFEELKSYENDVLNALKFLIERIKYFNYLNSRYPQKEAEERKANIEELIASVEEIYSREGVISINDWLSRVSLYTQLDDIKEEMGVVTLLTAHMAKGLEFPVVIITGLEEGTFPHYLALNSSKREEEIEEERRLFYVALTRAKEKVYLLFSKYRRIRRNFELEPSRFIFEIDDKYLEWFIKY